MTKDEKIKEHKTLFRMFLEARSSISAACCSPLLPVYTHDNLRKINAELAVMIADTVETFIDDDFSDCDSDCATVQTFYVNNPAPTAEYSGIPVVLTKNKEKCYFPSYAEAARFLLKKFGVKDGWTKSSVYSAAIGKYFNEPNNPRSYLLHDYIPSRPNFKEC